MAFYRAQFSVPGDGDTWMDFDTLEEALGFLRISSGGINGACDFKVLVVHEVMHVVATWERGDGNVKIQQG